VKKIALLSAGAVMAGSLVAVGAPAEAAGLDYTCNDRAGATAVNTLTAPATMTVGDSAPVSFDSALTVPSTLLGTLLGALGTLTGSGTGGAAGAITGPGGFSQEILPTGATFSGLSTRAPVLPLTGTTKFAPSSPGLYQVAAGKDSASLGALLGTLALDCFPAGGSNPVLGTIRVLSPSTTTVSLSPTTVAYGQTSRATAKVATSMPSPPAGLGDASGTVQFSVGDKTVSGALTSGETTVALPRLRAGHTYPVAAVYQPDSSALYDGSRDNASLLVVKDGTRTVATAPTIKRRHVEVATVKVGSTHGAMVRGTVRAVLKKGTKTLRAKTVTLRNGTAKVRFGKLRKKGRYTVIATYRGSQNFKRSVDKDAFKVR
jgi:hypothetical protein